MLTSITYTMTKHCQVERRERIERMERDLRFGKIICTTIYRGTQLLNFYWHFVDT